MPPAFDPTKTLESFDFSFNPTLNKAQIFDLATCQFIARREAVLLYGPTGVGKSHVAQALAHEACRRGYEVHSAYPEPGTGPSGRSSSASPCWRAPRSIGSIFRAEHTKKQVASRRARAATT